MLFKIPRVERTVVGTIPRLQPTCTNQLPRGASRDSWLVHKGSNLGIVPTTVHSTLGILQNICARHFKYREGSTFKLK